MAVSAVWRLVYPLAAYPSEPRSRPQHTGETRCAPLLKSKSKRLLVLNQIVKNGRDAAPPVSQTSGATRRLWDAKAPPTSALRDYGLASQARETDGDGAPSLPIWKGARCAELKPLSL